MIPEAFIWLIFFLPLASFTINGFVVRPFFNKYSEVSAYITILGVGIAFVLSLWALGSVIDNEGPLIFSDHSWIKVDNFDFALGILMDPLTAIMLVVVSGISLLVQVYSIGYMKGDPSYTRYYAYMAIFTASMLGLVLASNIIQLFVFWELVGLSSYLLIGFWFQRPAAAAAAKKAFIVTRIGDFGFLLAILYLFFNVDSFNAAGLNPLVIPDIYVAVETGVIASGVAMWIAIGIFAGAVGKSGQFPLHTWLPDAMEGPTPVSALIHAATMVAAGVFLVARFFPVFEASPTAMNLVAIIGAFTAIFAATMGLVNNDIKRVLAYSTISQLGYMMLALGVGAYSAALFHLFTHAFFKALLFLGSGSINHATGTFDMRYMGGLRKVMPLTYVTFLIGGLSLAGIFPLAGFWSKDEILAHAWNEGNAFAMIAFWFGLIAVFLTAFYMFRALIMTFHGEFRGGADADPASDSHGAVHLAESPNYMTWPLVVLGIATVIVGFAVNPLTNLGFVPIHWFGEFLNSGPVHVEIEKFNKGLAAISSLIAVAGIGLAYLMYYKKSISAEEIGSRLKYVYTLLYRKYYFDEMYERYIVTRGFYNGIARSLDWADKSVVDRTMSAVGWLGANTGGALRQIQTGQLQSYGAMVSVGILVIFGIFLITR